MHDWTHLGPETAALLARAESVTASETYDLESRVPAIIREASGPWVWDHDGRRLLDLTAVSGAILLGHRHPKVNEALVEQVNERGTMFPSTISEKRVELAERLCERYPLAEKVAFFRTGSDATTAAIRLAKAATKRPLVVSSGYHGWHDWQRGYESQAFDPTTGTINFGYSLPALRRVLSELGDQIACVMITPEVSWYDADYHRTVSAVCREYGVLFAIDEVMTGLRYGPRGLHGGADVPADIITVSKGLTNGYALSAVLGSRTLMDHYDQAGLAGTFNRELTPMSAAIRTLEIIDTEKVHELCFASGEALIAGFRSSADAAGIPLWVGGHPTMFDMVFGTEDLAAAVYLEALSEGVYFQFDGTQMVTAAWGPEEVELTLTAFDKAVRTVAKTFNGERGLADRARLQEFGSSAFGGVFVEDERSDEATNEMIRGAQRWLDVFREWTPAEAR